MALEYFLSICKPDAVRLGLVGEIVRRFEQRGLALLYVQWMTLTREQVVKFYYDRQTYGFFDELLAFMTSGPVVVTVWQGEDANNRGRQVVGNKIPVESDAGTIRGGLPAEDNIRNLVHGSRSPAEAWAEMQILAPERWDAPGEPVAATDRPDADSPYAPTERSLPTVLQPWYEPEEALP